MGKRTEQLLKPDVFLALVTKNYIEEVRNKDKEITEQISMAKEYGKPTFLIFLGLSDDEVKEADEFFKEHRIIRTLCCTSENFEREVALFAKDLKAWCDKNLGNKG